MTEAEALLAAIRQTPDDDAPRLIYADWLDEHDQPERAEFIRVQIELARKDSPALRRREVKLLAYHDSVLENSLVRFRYRRGFIVGFGHTGIFAGQHDGITRKILRFYPDGLAIESRVVGDISEVTDWFSRGKDGLTVATYRMDSDASVGRTWFQYSGGASRFRGTLLERAVLLGVENRMDDPLFTDCHEYVSIDGFDSFQDSP